MAHKISSPCVLCVEGKDELNVFSEIKSLVGFEALQIIDIGGKDKFRPTLEAYSKQAAFAEVRLLGIVRDCEEDGAAVFQSVLDSLAKIRVSRPTMRGESAGESPRVLVELLPPGKSSGCLETLFVEAAETLNLASCHKSLIACVRSLPNGEQFTQARFDKIAALAIMSSYQSKYHTQVGLALQSDEFRNFLESAPMRPLWVIVERLYELSKEVQ